MPHSPEPSNHQRDRDPQPVAGSSKSSTSAALAKGKAVALAKPVVSKLRIGSDFSSDDDTGDEADFEKTPQSNINSKSASEDIEENLDFFNVSQNTGPRNDLDILGSPPRKKDKPGSSVPDTPRSSLSKFLKDNDICLGRMRRRAMSLPYSDSAGPRVYWDSFNPPEGYTPDMDNIGLNPPDSQEAISPGVRMANLVRRKHKSTPSPGTRERRREKLVSKLYEKKPKDDAPTDESSYQEEQIIDTPANGTSPCAPILQSDEPSSHELDSNMELVDSAMESMEWDDTDGDLILSQIEIPEYPGVVVPSTSTQPQSTDSTTSSASTQPQLTDSETFSTYTQPQASDQAPPSISAQLQSTDPAPPSTSAQPQSTVASPAEKLSSYSSFSEDEDEEFLAFLETVDPV